MDEGHVPEAPESFTPDVDPVECGAVDVEGLRYLIMFGRRIRVPPYD